MSRLFCLFGFVCLFVCSCVCLFACFVFHLLCLFSYSLTCFLVFLFVCFLICMFVLCVRLFNVKLFLACFGLSCLPPDARGCRCSGSATAHALSSFPHTPFPFLNDALLFFCSVPPLLASDAACEGSRHGLNRDAETLAKHALTGREKSHHPACTADGRSKASAVWTGWGAK